MENLTVSDLPENTPESVAHTIFKSNPGPPFSKQIISEQDEEILNDLSICFEIVLTIFMEGIMILYDNLDDVDMTNFSLDHLIELKPWLHSLGFDLEIESVNRQDKEKYDDQYCKIIVRNSNYKMFFETKNIVKNYYFLANQKYYKKECTKKNLDELYTIFVNERTNIVYIIRFKFLKHSS
jgi:hypothetical protein